MRNQNDSNFGRRIISMDNMFQSKRNYFDSTTLQERKDKESLDSSLSQTTINENESRKNYSNLLSDSTSIQSNSAASHQMHAKFTDLQQLQRHKEIMEPLGDICCKLDELSNHQKHIQKEIIDLLGSNNELENLVLEFVKKTDEKTDALHNLVISIQIFLQSHMKEISDLLNKVKENNIKAICKIDTEDERENKTDDKEGNELSITEYLKHHRKVNKRTGNIKATERMSQSSFRNDRMIYNKKEVNAYQLSHDSPFPHNFNDEDPKKQVSNLLDSGDKRKKSLEHGYNYHYHQQTNKPSNQYDKREVLKDRQIDMFFDEEVDATTNLHPPPMTVTTSTSYSLPTYSPHELSQKEVEKTDKEKRLFFSRGGIRQCPKTTSKVISPSTSSSITTRGTTATNQPTSNQIDQYSNKHLRNNISDNFIRSESQVRGLKNIKNQMKSLSIENNEKDRSNNNYTTTAYYQAYETTAAQSSNRSKRNMLSYETVTEGVAKRGRHNEVELLAASAMLEPAEAETCENDPHPHPDSDSDSDMTQPIVDLEYLAKASKKNCQDSIGYRF